MLAWPCCFCMVILGQVMDSCTHLSGEARLGRLQGSDRYSGSVGACSLPILTAWCADDWEATRPTALWLRGRQTITEPCKSCGRHTVTVAWCLVCSCTARVALMPLFLFALSLEACQSLLY